MKEDRIGLVIGVFLSTLLLTWYFTEFSTEDVLSWCVFPTVLAGVAAAYMVAEDPSMVGLSKGARRPKRSKDNELGAADLARNEHVRKWLKSDNPDLDTKLPVKDLRGSSGTILKKGDLVIPSGERNRHILIIAKTGSGKTTRMILPILYNDCLSKSRSTVVIDSKPEMWDKLAGMTNHYNPEKKILLFNPLDTLRSLSWNIVSKVEDDTDAKLIANTIITATDNPASRGDSPFFRNNALQLLNAIMVGLLNSPSEELSIPMVHQLVHAGKEHLCKWLQARPSAIRISKTFVELANSGSQNADTVLSELSMRLAAWDLSAIRATTAKSELNLESLVTEPTLLIVELRESEIEMLRPMANVIVIEILRYLTKYAERCPGQTLPIPVSLVIDEFASALGRLPDIHVKLNTLRSRNVSIVAAIQSIGQVKANYDKDADSVLAGFSTKILMPSLDFMDAEWASKESGQMTIRYKTKTSGRNQKITENFASGNRSTSEMVQQRAVLTPDEIGSPVDNAATFFLPNTPVFQGFLVPFYEVPEMVERIGSYNEGFSLRKEELQYQDQKLERFDDSPAKMSPQEARAELERLKKEKLKWDAVSGPAKDWWEKFEEQNKSSINTVLALAKELEKREATIADFFLAYIHSQAKSVTEILEFLDYVKDKLGKNPSDGSANLSGASSSQSATKKAAIGRIEPKKVPVDQARGYIPPGAQGNAANVENVQQNQAGVSNPGLQSQPHQASSELHNSEPSVQNRHNNQVNSASQNGYHNVSDQVQSGAADHQSTNGQNTVEKNGSQMSQNGENLSKPNKAPLSKTEEASRKVYVDGYIQMAQQLIASGKMPEYRTLCAMLYEDDKFYDEDIEHILNLGKEANQEQVV